MPILDRAHPIPLYAQLIDEIRQLIEDGTWTATSRIPSERELCGMFDVSRVTVRQAVGALVREGLLIRASGRGTYLAPQTSSEGAGSDVLAASGYLLQHGTHPGGWRFQPLRSPVPARVLSALGVEDSAALTSLARSREPDVRETVYLSNDRCPQFRLHHHNDVPLYETLWRYYGIVAERATIDWYAASSWSSAATESQDAQNREPVLRIRQTTFDRDGRAFEYVEIHHAPRADDGRDQSSDLEGRPS